MNKDKRQWNYYQNKQWNNIRSHLLEGYPRQNSILYSVKKHLSKGSIILEIWFGDWYLLNELSKNNYNVIWQDLSDINIEQTKNQWRNDKIDFKLWDDSWKLLVNNESLDWFVASEVLEHMSDNELQICVSEIYRCLKTWWYAFITFPCREKLEESFCICPECWTTFHKRWHKQRWDREKIDNVFSKFKIIKIKERFYRYPGNNKIEMILWFIMYCIRSFINMFIDVKNKTYFIILKK